MSFSQRNLRLTTRKRLDRPTYHDIMIEFSIVIGAAPVGFPSPEWGWTGRLSGAIHGIPG